MTTKNLKLLSNKPLLVNQNDFMSLAISDASMGDASDYDSVDGIAVIPIYGPLYHSKYSYGWRTSYNSIRRQFKEAIRNESVQKIALHCASPGGLVDGCFDLADEIYEARGQKEIISIIDEMACSACYAIASAADKIYIPRTGQLGSIGVIMMHCDESKWDEKMGDHWTAIYEGSRKNDFSRHEPLSKEAYDSAKNEINAIYDIFVSTVARNRNIDEKIVRDTQSAVFMGLEAVNIGLADAVMSNRQVMETLFKPPKKENIFMGLKTDLRNIFAGDHSDDDLEKTLASFGYVPKEKAVQSVDVDALKAEAMANGIEQGRKEASAEFDNIVNLCTAAKMPELAASLMGKTEDEVKAEITAAQTEETQIITSSVSATKTGEVNPLLADMKARYGRS